MKVLRVTVEQAHIDAGVRQSYRRCPVANAVRGVAPSCTGVGPFNWPGDKHWATLWSGGDTCGFPPEVGRLIRAYDNGGELFPFSFPCLAPDAVLASTESVDPAKIGEAWGYYRLEAPENNR